MMFYTITAEDLDSKKRYIGKQDLSEFHGNIFSEDDLGIIRFDTGLQVRGRIVLGENTGLRVDGDVWAVHDIYAPRGIVSSGTVESACSGIYAGAVYAQKDIKSALYVNARQVYAGGDIVVRTALTSYLGIEAGGSMTCQALRADRVCAGGSIECVTMAVRGLVQANVQVQPIRMSFERAVERVLSLSMQDKTQPSPLHIVPSSLRLG